MSGCSRLLKGLVAFGVASTLSVAFASGKDENNGKLSSVAESKRLLSASQQASPELTAKHRNPLPNRPIVVERGPGLPNDACDGAIGVGCNSSGVYSNVGAVTEVGDPNLTCSFGGPDPGLGSVWFSFVATNSEAKVSTCPLIGGGISDTMIAVYSGPCADLTQICCNDDFCGLGSEVCCTNLVVGQTYYIKVAAWMGAGTPFGSFNLTVTCPCSQACVSCQPNDLLEGEPLCSDEYADATNGGCNWNPQQFGSIACGQTVCGEAGTYLFTDPNAGLLNYRDTDWYMFNLGARTFVRWEATAEFPFVLFLINMNSGCGGATIIGSGATGGECGTAALERCLAPGQYVAFIAPSVFSGVPCGRKYRATLSCSDCPPGPSNDDCANPTPVACNSSGVFNNTFASTEAGEPNVSCAFGGPDPGLASVWFSFQATDTSARVSLCPLIGGGMSDTMVAVYDGACGSLVEIACNDDFCGLGSEVCVSGLTVGNTYRIKVSAWPGAGVPEGSFNLSVQCPCPAPPQNDFCEGAIAISTGTPVIGTTNGTTIDTGQASNCAGGTITSPGVWYTVVGTGNQFVATTCSNNTQYDTKLNVYCGACPAPLFCVTGIDDDPNCFVNFLHSTVSWCTAPGQVYYVLVHGFGGQTGQFELLVTDQGTPCNTPPLCVPPPPVPNDDCANAIIVTPGSSTAGTTAGATNDPQFNTTCGTTVTAAGVWYRVTGTGNTMTATTCNNNTGYDTKINVYCGSCSNLTCVTGNDDGGDESCDCPSCGGANWESRAVWCSQFGATYYILVNGFGGGTGAFQLDVFDDGAPCTATISCLPTGACCLPNQSCLVTTAAGCQAANGQYQGDGSGCGGANYVAASCSTSLTDISTTGTILNTASGCDDCFENVGLPFGFAFYGTTYNDVYVSSNGYLGLGAGSSTFTNQEVLPNPAVPNNIICPLWDDFNTLSAGEIYYQSFSSPDRFVVQWNRVRRFGAASGENTFQAILFSNGNMQFVYGAIEVGLLTPTVGIENATGTSGITLPDPTSSNSCQGINLVSDPNPCENLGCPLPGCTAPGLDVDFDNDCDVDLTDLAILLSNFGTPTGMTNATGDTDGDGDVDLTDLANLLARFGNVCHP